MEFIPFAALLSFITTSIIIELTPGPNMAYLAIVSLQYGRKAGLAVTAGVALGLLIIGIASAMGVGALIANSPFAYQTLRVLGVGYLFWLAWDGWTDEPDMEEKSQAEQNQGKFFRRGLITNVLNPKAAIFYIAILPNFISPTANVFAQATLLTVLFVAIATAIHVSIVMLAGTVFKYIKTPTQRRTVRRVLSLLLAGVAIWFAISTGKVF